MAITIADIERACQDAANRETALFNGLYDALAVLRSIMGAEGAVTTRDRDEYERLRNVLEEFS